MGRALDWYQIFGSTLVQNTATDFAQLKAALSKAFPAIQNKKELENRFYASRQRQNQEPTDFVDDLLMLHKKLELGMSEKVLVDHIFVRLEPQVQDFIEVRNPQTAIQLLEVLAKFEERYSCKATLGSRNSNNVEGRGWNERRMSNVGNNRGNWRNSEVVHIYQIMVEMIIGVAIRTTVKEISGSRAGIGFKTMIAYLTIGDINLEIEVKMTILVEGTKEIGFRVKILVEAVENRWDV
ncbi:uncharacterized protein TNCV_27701 [Trichonephila clavipes]|uniref:Retrotransposon gag domain-containing protein n=1 Tax=Trichonephila clavipes TaxID=2585209 RepID=A0A8X6WKT0_TRICX|nr:uncharacterized protein TNCV_27701 [Trichonephila clavipes]